ncbi:hypothetical protein [Lutibacter sp. A80]|nr:hypothetical protein [Lutibacter sp. A80]
MKFKKLKIRLKVFISRKLEWDKDTFYDYITRWAQFDATKSKNYI